MDIVQLQKIIDRFLHKHRPERFQTLNINQLAILMLLAQAKVHSVQQIGRIIGKNYSSTITLLRSLGPGLGSMKGFDLLEIQTNSTDKGRRVSYQLNKSGLKLIRMIIKHTEGN